MNEDKPELCVVLKEATIEYTIKNVSKMKDPISSPPMIIQHLPWNILVKPSYELDIDKRPFGFYVTCDGNDSTNWTCRAEVNFNLCPLNKQFRLPFSRKKEHIFSAKDNTTGFDNYILWQDLINSEKRLINRDSITVEVCITHQPDDNEDTKADCSIVETVFRHTIKNISKIQETLILGPFPALNFSWKIILKLPSTSPAKPQSLGLFLQCNKDIFSDTWKCDARIELHLLNHIKSDEKLCRIIQDTFSSINNTIGIDDFIQWKDLLNVTKGYINDDSITVEVYVIPAKFDLQAYLNVREGTFWFKFKNVSKISIANFSSSCIIGNFPWSIRIEQYKKSDEKLYLACYLCCNRNNFSSTWSCDAMGKLCLLSRKQDQKSCKIKIPPKHFSAGTKSWGRFDFILWEDLMNPKMGYINNDSITIKAHVKILENPTESIEIK